MQGAWPRSDKKTEILDRSRTIAAEPHRAFAALRQPGYGAYLAGTMLAMMADSIEHVISYWMIYEKFQSPALGGYAVISHWLPFLLFSIWSGALADRFDPRRIIQFGMVLFMLCSLGWGVLFVTDTLQVWHAVVMLTVHGMAGVFWAPASQLLVHDIAGRDNLHSAVRLMAMARTLGLLGGPAVGGVMLLAFGPSLGMLHQCADLRAADLVAVEGAVRAGVRARSRGWRAKTEGGFAGVFATAREIAGNRIVVSMTLLAAASSFVIGNAYQAQMPEFAADLGHDHADFHYSMLLAANAAGALAAGLILETYGFLQARPKLAVVLVILWAICIGGFAVSDIYALSLALLVGGGLPQSRVQRHGADAGAAACAEAHPRPRDRPLQHVLQRHARVLRRHRRHGRQPRRRALVAGAERGGDARDRVRAARLRDAAAGAGTSGVDRGFTAPRKSGTMSLIKQRHETGRQGETKECSPRSITSPSSARTTPSSRSSTRRRSA